MDEKGDELDPEWGGGEVLLEDYVALVETVLPRIRPLTGDRGWRTRRTGTLIANVANCPEHRGA